jgi:hypothetical protein
MREKRQRTNVFRLLTNKVECCVAKEETWDMALLSLQLQRDIVVSECIE